MNHNLRILYITSIWPLGPADGAHQRVLNIGRLLGRFGDVSVVMVELCPTVADTVSKTEREFDVRRVIHPLRAGSSSWFHSLRHRARYEIDPRYLTTDHLTVSGADRDALLELMQEYDVVWVHKVRTANLFHINRWPRSILDVDDVPSLFYLSKAKSSKNLIRNVLDLRLSWMWRLRERLFTERFDAVTVCSERDRSYLGGTAQISVIPNGFDAPPAHSRVPSESPRIGFIGNAQYKPNEEGVRWFTSTVWPLIKRELPSAELRLVGLGTDGNLTTKGLDIRGLGWIEDPDDEIASWSAMIVPIRFGGGTRIKIAEGFARQCPIVSTTLGAFGYDVDDGKEILLADTADDFASACIRLLTNRHLRDTLAEGAYERFLERWTWDSFEGYVGAALQGCLSRSSRSQNGRASAMAMPR